MKKKLYRAFSVFAVFLIVFFAASCKSGGETPAASSSAPSESGEADTVSEENHALTGLAVEKSSAVTEQTAGVKTRAEDMTDGELVEYLLSNVPEASEMVGYGMYALVTGETSNLGGGICRDIWLGTDLGGKFTKEILYTVEASGAIYQFDVLNDEWILLNAEDMGYGSPPRTMLAFVKFDKDLGNGFAQLLADDVLWVDDDDAPNGYRIVNEVQAWVPYTGYEGTQCALYVYHEETGLERVQYAFDDFLAEIHGGFRSDGFLAEVTAVDGVIAIITEIYTP